MILVTQKSTWDNAPKSGRPMIKHRGIQKITKDMSEPARKGAEIWNEMVERLIEVGEMHKE